MGEREVRLAWRRGVVDGLRDAAAEYRGMAERGGRDAGLNAHVSRQLTTRADSLERGYDRDPGLPPGTFTCRVCGMVSHHPGDIEHGWCGNCNAYTGIPGEGR